MMKYIYKVPIVEDQTVFLYGNVLHEAFEGVKPTPERITEVFGMNGAIDFEDHCKLFTEYSERMGFTPEDVPEAVVGDQDNPFYLKHPITGDQFPIPFYGIIDRLRRAEKKLTGFVDYKTSSKPKSQTDIDKSVQFKFYHWVIYQLRGGKFGTGHMLNFMRNQVEGDPKVQVRAITCTVDDLVKLWDEMTDLHERVFVRHEFGDCVRHPFCPYKDAE